MDEAYEQHKSQKAPTVHKMNPAIDAMINITADFARSNTSINSSQGSRAHPCYGGGKAFEACPTRKEEALHERHSRHGQAWQRS